MWKIIEYEGVPRQGRRIGQDPYRTDMAASQLYRERRGAIAKTLPYAKDVQFEAGFIFGASEVLGRVLVATGDLSTFLRLVGLEDARSIEEDLADRI